MANGQYPYFRPLSANEATRARINGREVIMVGSNNYLGLTHDPRVVEASRQALVKFGTSCTGSRFLNGTLELHEELEGRLAKFLKKEAALVFSTGFQANLGAISALVGKERRHLLRPREPRVDHRRLPAFIRRGEEVPPRRHGRPAPHARADAGRQGQADHRRRRVLDEREHHQPPGDPGAGRRVQRARHGRRRSRHRPARGDRPRDPRALPACSTTQSATSTSSPGRSASRSRPSAASSPAPTTSSTTSSTTRGR